MNIRRFRAKINNFSAYSDSFPSSAFFADSSFSPRFFLKKFQFQYSRHVQKVYVCIFVLILTISFFGSSFYCILYERIALKCSFCLFYCCWCDCLMCLISAQLGWNVIYSLNSQLHYYYLHTNSRVVTRVSEVFFKINVDASISIIYFIHTSSVALMD